MKRLNLHIFYDPHGFFTNKTVDLINQIQPGQNIYLNTAITCIHKKEEIFYATVSSFLKKNSEFPVQLVVFHSYNYFNKYNIPEIKAQYKTQKIKFVWVFWSQEYYQLPEFFKLLYQGFSHKFYFRKLVSFYIEHFYKFIKREVRFPFYGGLLSLKKTYKNIDLMASLIKGDYDFVMNDIEKSKYTFISYISLNDFPDVLIDFTIQKNEIMVGHSGSPILNHYEIIKKLSDMNVQNDILIPLSYGKKSYLDTLVEEIRKFDKLNISFQTGFLSKDEYYRKIDNVGYFILNSFCQQALGNIVFFLWVGTKIFLQKNTSTYKTLKEKTFYVYSIEEIDNGLNPLTPEQKQHNHALISQMINEENVKESWLHILNFGNDQENV